MIKNIQEIFEAYKAEDERLYKLPETEVYGNPFTICTRGAIWLKKNYFPEGRVMGYNWRYNKAAEIGEFPGGHDFLVVNNKYLIDFWYRHVQDKTDAPIILDLETQKDLMTKYYGDPTKWEDCKWETENIIHEHIYYV